MTQALNPFNLLKEITNSCYTGQLLITSQKVAWTMDFQEGKLSYAVHSLQSIATLELCLYALGYGQAIPKISQGMAQAGLTSEKGERFIELSIPWLKEQKIFNLSNQTELINLLIQDALESFFWLTNGRYQFRENHRTSLSIEGILTLENFIKTGQKKQQAWQKFRQFINSPYQRPYCVQSPLFPKSIPSHSSHLLQKINQLKGKISIRQLSILLELDDLKVAELLDPYLKSKVVQLYSPLPPFEQLPQTPLLDKGEFLTGKKPLVSQKVQRSSSEENPKPKPHKIVCIDDSETVLNTFKRYLTSETTELYTLSDPTLAINKLFEIKPDLLLVDIAMPGINGDQLSKILKRSTAFQNLPIIIVSADPNKIKESQRKGGIANDFLQKPFNQDSLVTLIHKYLK